MWSLVVVGLTSAGCLKNTNGSSGTTQNNLIKSLNAEVFPFVCPHASAT